MAQGIALLNEALDLAVRERAALEGGEYEDAIELAAKRGELTGMACNMMRHQDEAPYRDKLMQLSEIQKQLTAVASRAQATVRQHMNRSKQERKRMQGYQMAVGQALQ